MKRPNTSPTGPYYYCPLFAPTTPQNFWMNNEAGNRWQWMDVSSIYFATHSDFISDLFHNISPSHSEPFKFLCSSYSCPITIAACATHLHLYSLWLFLLLPRLSYILSDLVRQKNYSELATCGIEAENLNDLIIFVFFWALKHDASNLCNL